MPKSQKPRRPAYDVELRERAKALYKDLRSVRAVAAEMEVSPSRAWRFLQDAGVNTKRKRARKRPTKGAAT